jgi:hypothetical protein
VSQITVYLNNETSVQRTLEYWQMDSENNLLKVTTKSASLYVFPVTSINYFVIEGE